MNDRLLKDFVDVYFRKGAFEAFCGSQKQVDQMLRQAHRFPQSCTAAASAAVNLLPPRMPFSAPLASAPVRASESNKDPGSAEVPNEMAALAKRFRN